ncbi:hypothetical protein IAD21_02144 [Abditibacteriota bacterium]|nr:hypothetical protein IAD21_02144 [Abditibacteriota bacterium]
MSEKTYLLLMAVVLGGLGVFVWKTRTPSVANAAILAPPSTLAKWPLTGATTQSGSRGVTHLSTRDADGTDIDVIEFDFKANPKLKLELFDQDSDDKAPFDNSARYWGRNAAYVLAHESNERGPLIATCNGGPFDFDRSKSVDDAHHVAPLVVAGKPHFQNLTSDENQWWVFGVRDGNEPRFETVLHPSEAQLQQFDYATGGVQCLIKDGEKLHLDDPPTNKRWGRIKPPGLGDVGTLGRADWTKTSRVSLGWNRDGSKLWMLSVHDPEAESVSRVALSLRFREQADASTPPIAGGWSVRDVQDFWKSQGAWGAVLMASGDFAQLAHRRADGQVDFVPSHVATLFWKTAAGRARLVCAPSLKGAPTGGSALFYWTVRETK